jgi:hypothetical protein
MFFFPSTQHAEEESHDGGVNLPRILPRILEQTPAPHHKVIRKGKCLLCFALIWLM